MMILLPHIASNKNHFEREWTNSYPRCFLLTIGRVYFASLYFANHAFVVQIKQNEAFAKLQIFRKMSATKCLKLMIQITEDSSAFLFFLRSYISRLFITLEIWLTVTQQVNKTALSIFPKKTTTLHEAGSYPYFLLCSVYCVS